MGPGLRRDDSEYVARGVASSTRRANHLRSCQAPQPEIFLFTRILICGIKPPARATMRDVRAIVTERGAGCDGPCVASGGSVIPEKWEPVFR